MKFPSLLLGIALALAILPKTSQAIVPCKDCNFILISLDTISASHLGAYGSRRGNSPNLDRFARTARLYRHAYAPAPWTLPSHAAMLTGYFPWHLGVQDEHDTLPLEVPTLAELLKQAGYRTSAFTSGHYVDQIHGFDRGFDTFSEYKKWKDASWIAEQGAGWLRENKGKKFFLFLHSYQAHEPFEPSTDSLKQLDPGYTGNFNRAPYEELVALSLHKKSLGAKDRDRLATLYDAGIMDLDRELGRLFQFLDSSGLNQNTIILVTADHGTGLGEHGLWGLHAYNVYDELTRIPLLLKAPQAAASEIDAPVSVVDIVPTILSYLGVPNRSPFDGRPMPEEESRAAQARNIYAQTAVNPEIALPFLELEVSKNGSSAAPARFTPRTANWSRILDAEKMVQSGRYKLILKFDRSFELFDLKKDPRETTNLMAKLPSVANRLKTLMLQERQ